MATGEHQQVEVSRYGPISTKSQATQTLPLQTQIPTQTVSHEVHQFTQLINDVTLDHGGGDTLVNDTDSEGSGNTVVLNDDDDDNAHGVAESGPSLGVKAGLGPHNRRHENPHSTPFAPSNLIDGCIAPHSHRDLPHSDATTEEGDVQNMGNLDADAESQPSLFNATADSTGVNSGGKPLEIVQPGVLNAKQNLALQKAPATDLLADMGGKKSSQKKRNSMASVRAESLHASGLRAISRSVSIGSAGKEDGNFDSDATGKLTYRKFPGGPKKPLEASETELENFCTKKRESFDSMHSSPKATLLFDDTMARSPRLSTSRLKCKRVPRECAPQQLAVEQEHIDVVDIIESDRDVHEGLSRFGHAMPAHNVRQPSSQKARKLVFDCTPGTSPMMSVDKVEPAQGSANAKAVDTEHDYVLKKPMADALARERICSSLSGVRAASTNLSYLESQEPGEESQANALNMVDKLVWLDETCMSDDVVTSPVPQNSSIKFQEGANGRQSLAQAAQMKTVHDKLDVFDWEDSQAADEAVSPQQVPASTKALKRHSEAFEPSDRKKRVTNNQQKIETSLHVDKTGDDSRAKTRTNPDVGNIEVPNMEPSISNQEVKPHILFATRLRNMKAESGSSSKGIKSQGLKIESKKYNNHKDEAVMELEPGQQKGGDGREGKVQQASLGMRTSQKKKAHGSGKELETEKQKVTERKGRKVRHTDSSSVKGKRKSLKTADVGTQCEGYVAVADRTSEADAAADIWIDAFTNKKNKTAAGSDMEVIKFRKRGALHEDTSGDLKKSRTTEPTIVPCNKELHTMTDREAPLKKDRGKSGLSIQQATNGIHAAAIPQNKDRRVSTQFSQEENKDIEKAEGRMKEQSTLRTMQRSKKPRIADDMALSQVKGRRISTRNSQREHQDPSRPEHKQVEEDKAGGPKIRQDPKESGMIDSTVICGDKSRGVRTRGGAVEHTELENVRLDDKLERGPNTRARAQDAQSVLIANDAKECTKARNATIKNRRTKAAPDDIDESFLPRGMLQGDDDKEKPSAQTSSSKKKDITWLHQNMMSLPLVDAHESEANPTLGALAKGYKKSKRRRESSNVNVLDSSKAEKNPGSRLKDSEKDISLTKIRDVDCRRGDASSTVLLRRARSGLCDGGSQKDDPVDIGKGNVPIQGDPTTEKQSLQDHGDSLDARKGLSKQVSRRTMNMKSIKYNKQAHTHKMLYNVFDEGRRRKRESGCICVLFSHSLTEETIKHQKKILAKLGGHLAKSASDCTHFVCNGFARSQNMLISMAAGKEVVTTLWLESCGQACYFVDEKAYIPQDVKKERELGFSMMSSLASARRKPLLKGFNVLVCPNTVPEPAVLKAIIESAGGQVVDVKSWHFHLNEKESDTPFIVIGNEKDADFCVQFLGKGLKVYSEELLLHGIVTQMLDYSRYYLFENFKQQRGPRRASSMNA